MAKGKKPRKVSPLLPVLLGILALALVMTVLLHGTHNVALFNPRGLIANEQHRLMVVSTLIMLGFGVPVILAIYFIAWRYREDNQKSEHASETKVSKSFLLFAWGGPLVTVILIAFLLLSGTYQLQPQKPINADKDQITIDVVALRWKWLFIYPEQHVASVNFAQIPVNTPVRFEMTADEMPMSSFWIPNLAGMLYTMTGHVNTLNLMADTVGDYPGKTAEINGPGYAGMKFITRVSSQKGFDDWVTKTKKSPVSLTQDEYQKLLVPSENSPAVLYANPTPDLFSTILSKYQHNMDRMDMEAKE